MAGETAFELFEKIKGHLRDHQLDDALELANMAVQNFPGQAKGHFLCAEIYAQLQETGKAIKYLKSACTLNPQSIMYLGNLAEKLFLSGEVDEAILYYQKILAMEPVGWAYIGLGNAFEKIGNISQTIECFQKALQISDKYHDVRQRLQYLQEKYDIDALDLPQVKTDKKNLSALEKLEAAQFAAANGDTAKALSYYMGYLSDNPLDFQVHHKMGDLYLRLKRYDDAKNSYHSVLLIHPDYEWTLHNLSLACGLAGEWDDALLHYHRLGTLNTDFWVQNSNDYNVQKHLGYLLLHSNNPDEAKTIFENAIVLSATGWESHLGLALCYEQTGTPNEALNIAKRGLLYCLNNSALSDFIEKSEAHMVSISDDSEEKNVAVTVKSKQAERYTLDVAQLPTPPKVNDVKLIAFYLPQYHPFEENNRWWGQGFTEWTNVTKAEPLFEGHYHPRLPADLGFYDLRLNEVREHQAELAKYYGIHGFCYYYYWFAGKRLLERPIDEMLALGKPDMPFCLCWANENWTRRWDGAEHDILMEQVHTSENNEEFAKSLVPFLLDKRYIKVNGKPLLVIYRADIIPDIENTLIQWRSVFRKSGVGEVHICGALTFGISTKKHKDMGFDASVEFPPHNSYARSLPPQELGLPLDFSGQAYDYNEAIKNGLASPIPKEILYPGVITGWDNTARKGKAAHFFINSNPERYEFFLRGAIEKAKNQSDADNQLVFINAWNEWAEGTYLEPDRKNGHQFLMATSRALNQTQNFDTLLELIENLNDVLPVTQIETLIKELAEINASIYNTYNALRKMVQDLKLEQLLIIQNNILQGDADYAWYVDSPVAGLELSRKQNIIISGWFLCKTTEFEEVDIFVYSGEDKLASGRVSLLRKDVFDYYQCGSEICGFNVPVFAGKCNDELRVVARKASGDLDMAVIQLQVNTQQIQLPGYLVQSMEDGAVKNEEITQVLTHISEQKDAILSPGRLMYSNEIRSSGMLAMKNFLTDTSGSSLFPSI